MKHSLIFLFLFFLITNFSDKYDLSIEDKEYLIKTIDSIYEIDQGKRFLFDKADSLYNLEPGSFMYRKKSQDVLGSIYQKYNKTIDSIWKVLKVHDEANTKMLIALIKEYGFPSNERLGVYKSKAYWIFVHSPKKLFPEVKPLILEEYKNGRLTEHKKEYIFWHINGRKGMPPRSGKNGEAIYNK